jgi:prolipoprotein diacylglyceryltransferase
MSAYIIFTRIRTRDPAELARYAAQAPTFMAGHTIGRLASFGACEVVVGIGLSSVQRLWVATSPRARRPAKMSRWISRPKTTLNSCRVIG